MISPAQMAEMLNGRQYLDELTPDMLAQADACSLVIVLGRSDDIIVLKGALSASMGCYRGDDFKLDREGFVVSECSEGGYCPYYKKYVERLPTLTSVWAEGEYSWSYRTDIPHASFDILEDDEKYCRGIVFSLNDLPEGAGGASE